MGRINSPQALEQFRKEIIEQERSQSALYHRLHRDGMPCLGMPQVVDAFKKVLQNHPKGNRVNLRLTGCHGFCEKGPLVVIHPQKILYQRVKPENAQEIFEETVLKGKIIETLLYEHPTTRREDRPGR